MRHRNYEQVEKVRKLVQTTCMAIGVHEHWKMEGKSTKRMCKLHVTEKKKFERRLLNLEKWRIKLEWRVHGSWLNLHVQDKIIHCMHGCMGSKQWRAWSVAFTGSIWVWSVTYCRKDMGMWATWYDGIALSTFQYSRKSRIQTWWDWRVLG